MKLIKATETEKNRIINYLLPSVENCIYMYIDISTNNLSNKNIDVWFCEKESNISFVMMRYYNTFQIFGEKIFDECTEIENILRFFSPSMISGPKYLVEILSLRLDGYEVQYGSVFRYNNYLSMENSSDIEIADENDADEIAQLLYSDPGFFANYSLEDLRHQIRDRIITKSGRSYVIRRNDEIIAHVATFAENDKLAVVSGAFIKTEYRKEDFFDRISGYISNVLNSEGKDVYSFTTNTKLTRWLNYIHVKVGEYGKMVKS